jgi:hypothetical protein
MGDQPQKMPGGKKKARRHDTNFTEYAEGGEVWRSPTLRRNTKSSVLPRKPQQKSRSKSGGTASTQTLWMTSGLAM